METGPQQLPTVPADTTRLIAELERLAANARPANSTPPERREPELVIRGSCLATQPD